MPRVKDKIWAYGEDLNGRFVCNFCKKNYSGGASRLKAHLSCLSGRDIACCTLVPEDVQAQAILMVGGDKASKKQKVGPSSPPLEGFGGVWWSQNGGLIPVVQKVAIRLLSQPCSASACERNWSAFEAAQTKKRNKLSPEMLEDLVYIRMNSKMKDKVAALEVQDTKAINLEQLGELAEYEDHNDVDDGNQDSTSNSTVPSAANADLVNVMFEELFGRE